MARQSTISRRRMLAIGGVTLSAAVAGCGGPAEDDEPVEDDPEEDPAEEDAVDDEEDDIDEEEDDVDEEEDEDA